MQVLKIAKEATVDDRRVIPAELTISRIDSYNGKAEAHIAVKDSESRIVFVEIVMPMEDIAKALFGLANTQCTAEIKGLDKVGKRRETKQRKIVLPNSGVKRRGLVTTEDFEQWVEKNCQKKGWILNPRLRSQGSIVSDSKNTTLSVSYARYVQCQPKTM